MTAFYALVHKDEDSAFGIQFPDLPSVFSAADEEEDIIDNATQALRLWAEDEALPDPSAMDDLLARDEVKAELAQGAFLVRVSVIKDSGRTMRKNISLDQATWDAIDQAAARRDLNRSSFLATAARNEIERAG